MVGVMRVPSRRWLAGAVLVAVGWLASPGAVPVYDGIAAPDEPYRYVNAPGDASKTAPPTSVSTDTPVTNGANAQGLSLQTAETGPQFSVFLPQYSMRAARGPIHIAVSPAAPAGIPASASADGNTYVVSLTSPAGPVEMNPKYAAIATLYLRATSQSQPQPTMWFRAGPSDAFAPLATSAGGLDVRVASFRGAGEYVLVRTAAAAGSGGGSSVPVLPIVLLGVLVLLAAVVFVVRMRATPDGALTAATE
jgi:hypothetical protein